MGYFFPGGFPGDFERGRQVTPRLFSFLHYDVNNSAHNQQKHKEEEETNKNPYLF